MNRPSNAVKEKMREKARQDRFEKVRHSQADSNTRRHVRPLFGEPRKCSPSSKTEEVEKVLGHYNAIIQNTREMQYLIGVDNLPLTPLPDSGIPKEFPSKKPSANSTKEQILNGEIKLENSTERKNNNGKRKSNSSDGSLTTEGSKSSCSHDSNHETSLGSFVDSKSKTIAEVDKKLSKDSGHHQNILGIKYNSAKQPHSHNNHHHSTPSLSTKSSPSHSNKHAHSPTPHRKNEKMSPSKLSSKNLKNHLSSVLHPEGAKDTVPPNGINKEVGNVFMNVLKPKLNKLHVPSKEHNMSDDVGAMLKEMMGIKEPLTAILTPGHKQDRFPFSTPVNDNAKRNGKKIEDVKKGDQIISEESLSKQLSISDDSDTEQAVTKLPADRRGTAPVKEPKHRRMSSSSDSSSSGSESGSESESQSSDEEEEKEKEKVKSPEADPLSSPTQEGEKKMPWSLSNFIPKGTTPTGLVLTVGNAGSVGGGSKEVDKENEKWLRGWNIFEDEEFFPHRDQPVSDDAPNVNVDTSSEQSIQEQNLSEQISLSEILSPIQTNVFPSHSSSDISANSPCHLDKMQRSEKSEHRPSNQLTPSNHHSLNLTPSRLCVNSVSSKNSNSADKYTSRTSTPTRDSSEKEKSLTPKSEKKRRRTSGNVPQKDLVWEKQVKDNQYHSYSDSDSDFVVETVTPEKEEVGVKSKEISMVSKVLNLHDSCVGENENSNERTVSCDAKSDTNAKYRPTKHAKSKVPGKFKDVICDRNENKNCNPAYLESDMEHIFSSVIGGNNSLLSPLPHPPVKLQLNNDISFLEGKPSIIVHLNLSFLNHVPLKGKLSDSLKTKKDCLESKLTSKLDEEKTNKIDISASEDFSLEYLPIHKKKVSGSKPCSPERIKSAKRKLEEETTEEQKHHKTDKSSHKQSESPARTANTENGSPLKKTTPDSSEQTTNTKSAFKRISDVHEKDTSSTKQNVDSPCEKPPKINERRSSFSSNSSQHSHKSKRPKHSKEETSTIDQHLIVSEKTPLQNKLPQVFQNGHGPAFSHKTEPLPIICPYSRFPTHDEKSDSADRYLTQAKELKHKADTLKDKLAKLLTYIEAVLSFLECGSAMEREHISEANKISTMYKDTLRLITHICRFRGSHETDLTEKEKKLSVLSLRIQSLLCLKLFSLKKQETLKLKRIIDEHNKGTTNKPSVPAPSPSPCQTGWSNRTTGTPSPMSPTPSPAGSVGSVGSQGSCNDLTPSKLPNGNLGTGTTVAVPQRIHSISQHYLKTVNFLVQCHDYWDQADAAMQDYEEFFRCLDMSVGQLSLHSSIPELVRYVCLGLQYLKDT